MPFDPIPYGAPPPLKPRSDTTVLIDAALRDFGPNGEHWRRGHNRQGKMCVLDMLGGGTLPNEAMIELIYRALPRKAQERPWWMPVCFIQQRLAVIRYNDRKTTTYHDIRALLLRARKLSEAV